MMKAVKKLKKFWPRNNRRKKTYQEPYYHHPPPPCHCCCSYSTTPIQPSAPPLPPWLEPEQQTTHEAFSSTGVRELVYQSQIQYQSQQIVAETNAICPTLPIDTPLSYQQYTVPNPVYRVPVVQTTRTEMSAGFFECVVSYGLNLIRCFCPCFRIREIN